jgi:DNA-binding NtrC family response regulator
MPRRPNTIAEARAHMVSELRKLVDEIAARASRSGAASPPRTTAVFGDLITSIERGARPRIRVALREFERRYILAVLTENRGNISATARTLGTDRQGIQRKLRQYRSP